MLGVSPDVESDFMRAGGSSLSADGDPARPAEIARGSGSISNRSTCRSDSRPNACAQVQSQAEATVSANRAQILNPPAAETPKVTVVDRALARLTGRFQL